MCDYHYFKSFWRLECNPYPYHCIISRIKLDEFDRPIWGWAGNEESVPGPHLNLDIRRKAALRKISTFLRVIAFLTPGFLNTWSECLGVEVIFQFRRIAYRSNRNKNMICSWKWKDKKYEKRINRPHWRCFSELCGLITYHFWLHVL